MRGLLERRGRMGDDYGDWWHTRFTEVQAELDETRRDLTTAVRSLIKAGNELSRVADLSPSLCVCEAMPWGNMKECDRCDQVDAAMAEWVRVLREIEG